MQCRVWLRLVCGDFQVSLQREAVRDEPHNQVRHPVPCTDEEWLAEPSPYSAFDYLCAQEVGDTIIENGDCFDCDLSVPAVGCADCTAKSGCFWCAASFSCTSNNSGCADAVAAECEDLTSLCGFVFNDPALPAQLWHLRAVNVEPAWVAGFTGAGINILFIDDPADILQPTSWVNMWSMDRPPTVKHKVSMVIMASSVPPWLWRPRITALVARELPMTPRFPRGGCSTRSRGSLQVSTMASRTCTPSHMPLSVVLRMISQVQKSSHEQKKSS